MNVGKVGFPPAERSKKLPFSYGERILAVNRDATHFWTRLTMTSYGSFFGNRLKIRLASEYANIL